MPLKRPSKRLVLEIGAVGVAGAILAILISLLSDARGMATAGGQPLLGDYIAFWSAGRATLEGHIAEIHERATMMAYQQQAAPGVRFFAPWNSPPTFLLIVTPFALLPYAASAGLFLLLTGAFYLFVARKILPDARALLFAVTAPAAFYHLGTVQIGLLIAALTGLALLWMDRRPRAAGALVGLLAIKPHLALMWPIALALTGRWQAFFAAAISVTAFALLAGFVFGFESYLRFYQNLADSAQLISGQRITTPSYASLYGNLLQWDTPQTLAITLHIASALAAIGAAAFVFRRGAPEAQAAALCAATLLISPYLFFYDAILLALGLAFLGAPRGRFELATYVLAWGAALTLPIGHFFMPLPISPVAAWLLLFVAIRRARIAGLPQALARPT